MGNSTTDKWNSLNQDISGIGVRTSFYLQTFFLVLLVNRSREDAPVSLWTLIATSAGLIIGAVAQHAQITLLQALIVSNLVWLANFAIFGALASYSRHKKMKLRDRKLSSHKLDSCVKPAATTLTLVSMGLTLYVWAQAGTRRFGAFAEDSDKVRYAMFFAWPARATGAGHIAALNITALLTFGYLLLTVHELLSYLKSHQKAADRRKRRPNTFHSPEATNKAPALPADIFSKEDPPLTKPGTTRSATQSSSIRLASRQTTNSRSQAGMEVNSPSPRLPLTDPVRENSRRGLGQRKGTNNTLRWSRRSRQKRLTSTFDPMFVGVILFELVVFSYFIISTELTLNVYNGPPEKESLEFGQILPLVLVIPSALSLIDALGKHGLKHHTKSRSAEKRRRQGVSTAALDSFELRHTPHVV